ncbi:MAG: peptidylprolyl isomerase [Bacteroidota bacterium]
MLRFSMISVLVVAFLMACTAAESGKEFTTEQLNALGDNKDFLVTIETPMGTMHAILYDETPKHKANFIKLAQEGFFDSLLFHRVMEKFMIQGGDPNSKGSPPNERLGNGGPGYTIPAEFVDKFFHRKGALSAARQPDQVNPEKESSGSQFYIVQGEQFTAEQIKPMRENSELTILYQNFMRLLSKEGYEDIRTKYGQLQQERDEEGLKALIKECKPDIKKEFGVEANRPLTEEQIEVYSTVGGTPHLDYEYTVFGQVIDGLDVVDKIAAVQTGQANRPTENIWMKVSVEEVKKKKIAKEFGYIYPEMR